MTSLKLRATLLPFLSVVMTGQMPKPFNFLNVLIATTPRNSENRVAAYSKTPGRPAKYSTHDRIPGGYGGCHRGRAPGRRHLHPDGLSECGRHRRRFVLGSRPPQQLGPARALAAEVLRRNENSADLGRQHGTVDHVGAHRRA